MINLAGKVSVVTGGSRGIGKEIVRLFSEAGASVIFTYRRAEKEAKTLHDSLKNPAASLPMKVDCTHPDEIRHMVGFVLDRYGKIDILVHNAGIWTEGKIEIMDEETWNETIRTNLTSAYLLCREIVPVMKNQRSGRIIFISSTAGQRGEAERSHYAASKGGIISFTKSLAAELGPFGIRTNSVAPGWVRTDMTESVFRDPEFLAQVERSIPLGYVPHPREIAGPVLFLASDLALHVNGEILNVNGGSVLCG